MDKLRELRRRAAQILFRALWKVGRRLGWRPRSVPVQAALNPVLNHKNTPQATTGRLRYFTVKQAVVIVGDLASVHKVVQFGFLPDGGIYVQSPYFGSTTGVLSVCVRDPKRPGGTKETYDLAQHGRVALDVFKMSHHASGFVHFSDSAHERSGVERQSFRVSDGRGVVCDLTFGPISAFSEVGIKPEKAKKGRVYLPFLFTDHVPDVLKVVIEWKPKASLQQLGLPEPTVGPLYSDSQHGARFFVGQPAGMPLQSGVIEVQCGPAPRTDRDSAKPFLALIGGLDTAHARTGNASLGSGFLALLYPIEDPGAISARAPIIQRRSKKDEI